MPFAIILLFVIISSGADARKLLFPKANYTGSTILAISIPRLTKDVLKQYKEPDQSAYFNNVLCNATIEKEFSERLFI